MGVIIKNMEMPENCSRCDFIKLNAAVRCFLFTGVNGRAKDCPLVEISTPHGRLIDADELKKGYPHDADWEYPVNTNEYVSESIDNAQTVVEAEKEEHDE